MDKSDYDGIPVKVKKSMHSANLVHISPLQGQETFCSIQHGKTRQIILDSFEDVEVCTICKHKLEQWPDFIREAYESGHMAATA